MLIKLKSLSHVFLHLTRVRKILLPRTKFFNHHKIRHPRCVYNKLDWSLYTCLAQLYGGIDVYNLLHKELHVSALFIGHLQVYK